MNLLTPEWKSGEHVWGGHPVAIRAALLGALSGIFPVDEWLHEAIEYHGKWLLDHCDGYWNHWRSQALALVVVGGVPMFLSSARPMLTSTVLGVVS